MQKQAKQFIKLLESQQLLSDEIVEELHRQVAESRTKLSPELLAKLLVDNGHLTKFQATKLIAEIKEPISEVDSLPEEEELGLATPDHQTGKTATKVAAVFIDEGDEIIDVDVVEVEPVEVVEAVEAVEVVEHVEVVEPGFGSESMASPVRRKTPASNPWDSFRILGIGIFLALVSIAGSILVFYFWRGNAEDRLNRANESYESRSYETAATMYKEFVQSFPTDASASFAKVRAALASLRKEAEGAPDPMLGLRVALEVLPGIAGEPGLADQQSDLAGVLVSLAAKFNDRADRTAATDDRKALMAEMDKLLGLINDPQFVGVNQRNQQAPTLLRIQEDRERILREINRDEELSKAIVEIDQRLEAKDILAAYEIRRDLINRYPLLEAAEPMVTRVKQASALQQSLVTTSSLNIKLDQQSPPSPIAKSFVLGNRSGQGAPSLAGQVVFAKVKGSVYGLDGASGDILWRFFVGRDFDDNPIRLGETSASDALICQPQEGWLSRVDGRTGQVKWHVNVGTPAHPPIVESQDLLVATLDGNIANLDPSGGQTKWTKKLPQPVPVGPGCAFGKPNLYLPADHSNLYVLSRQDGACKEVFYLGHRPGSITVPPLLLLGQLFVFENINADSSKIRILSTSDQGLELRDAQASIPVGGNVVVQPQVDGRRLIVQTDLGQIVVLDVEPTAATQKVSTIASIPKNLLQPQLSWSVTANNKIWAADSRFTLFDLQVSLGKLNRVYIKNPGDTFTSPPQKIGEVVIHTRRLRGNLGDRVAAVKAEDGEPLWETDLGVPVGLIASSGKGKIDAINSSGMYFSLDGNLLRSTANANPGQGKSSMKFVEPVALENGSVALLNSSKSNQLALYSPQNSRLSILSAVFGSAAPSCAPIAVGDNLAIGLDNGQFLMIDPTNGSVVAAPYQPPMEPGKKVRWNRPIYLADSQTLIVASDLSKIVRLGIGTSLRALTEMGLEKDLSGPLAAVGNRIVAVESSNEGDALVFFDATSLARMKATPLAGRLISGPFGQMDHCIVQTEGKLSTYSSEGQPLWSIDFPTTSLVSEPTSIDGNLAFATRSGQVWIVNASTGEVVGNTDLGQPLSSAPLLVPGAGLLLGSDEGAVLAIPVPSSRMEGTDAK